MIWLDDFMYICVNVCVNKSIKSKLLTETLIFYQNKAVQTRKASKRACLLLIPSFSGAKQDRTSVLVSLILYSNYVCPVMNEEAVNIH